MKTRIIYIFVTLIFATVNFTGFSQSAKKQYKTGKKYSKLGNYEEAINYYSKAIDINPQYTKAYSERAFAYEEIEDIRNAAKDYKLLTVFKPKEYKVFYKTALLYYKLKKVKEAVPFLVSASKLEEKNAAIYELKYKCYIHLNDYKSALNNANKSIQLNKTAENYYYRGIILNKLENYPFAENDFAESVKLDAMYTPSHIGLGAVRLKQNKLDDALVAVNKSIQMDPKNKVAFLLRSKIYKKKLDYPSAIKDLSKLSLLYPNDEEVFFEKGLSHFEFNQFKNAINDFSKVLALNPKNKETLLKRANSYEQISSLNKAIKDYKNLLAILGSKPESEKLLKTVKDRLFELNKEQNIPIVSIVSAKILKKNTIEVPGNLDKVSVKIKISDESRISVFMVDDQAVYFKPDSVSSGILVPITIKGKKEITIACEDVYKNKYSESYKLIRTETGMPKVALLAPYGTNNTEILLDSKDPELYVEGKVSDKSKIGSILINGITANYKPDVINPKFSAKINIANKEKLEIVIKDIYGNTLSKEFKLNRTNADLLSSNPMGRTWVVFIENSDYKSFTSLDAPKKDIKLMKGALAKYKIHNIIHKRNMSKRQLDKFFSVELRDLVRSNRVNSILLWYAGHGKFIRETGYWIPTDAKSDEEFSYYNTNSLKNSMRSYSKNISHTLIVTDACESGPTFYMAMRSLASDRDCNDTKATKFKSSQVFTSAGYEQAADKSQFTKTFANSLNYNEAGCIPIERIVRKVSVAVQKNSEQRPKFGKISGFEDENGTFFFIRK